MPFDGSTVLVAPVVLLNRRELAVVASELYLTHLRHEGTDEEQEREMRDRL